MISKPLTSVSSSYLSSLDVFRGIPPEQAELEALRNKWAAMDAQSDKTQANVEVQMQRWSIQRARFEEEIIRRQEASRFAAPSMSFEGHAATLGAKHAADGGYMSPYRHVASNQVQLA